MGKKLFRTMLGLAFFCALSQIPFAIGAGDGSFNPVQLRTEPLTMTGTAEPASTPQADPTFNSVHITTEPLTMTGIAP